MDILDVVSYIYLFVAISMATGLWHLKRTCYAASITLKKVENGKDAGPGYILLLTGFHLTFWYMPYLRKFMTWLAEKIWDIAGKAAEIFPTRHSYNQQHQLISEKLRQLKHEPDE